jgi:HEAT repeat protein
MYVRYSACRALDRIGYKGNKAKKSYPLLVTCLKDKEPLVRQWACSPLVHIGTDRSDIAKNLIPMLKDESPEVRSEAAKALGWNKYGNEMVLKALTEAFQDSDVEVRDSVLRAFGNMGPTAKKAIPLLCAVLKNRTCPRLRSVAAGALADMGPEAKEALPTLLEYIKDDDVNVRLGVANALAGIGRPAEAAIPALVETLVDKDSNWDAALALVAINPQKAVPAIPVFKKVLETDFLGEAAAIELEKIGTPEAKELVRQYRERQKNRFK